MTIATQLYEKEFHSTRDARSEAYRAGVLDTLNFKESGTELNHPYQPGTADDPRSFVKSELVITEVSPIPIPAAIWLFGTALIGFVGMSRRKKVA